MPILTSPLTYPAASPFAILDDAYLGGSFKVIKNEAERDSLSATNTIKAGTLVKCQESGIYWRASNVKIEVDEFGDAQTRIEWEEFKFEASRNTESSLDLYRLYRTSFSLDIEKIGDGRSLEFTQDLKCYSFFMLNLRVSEPVKIEIQSQADGLDRNPYVFIARYDHLADSGESFIQYSGLTSSFKASAYSILVNEDPEPTTNFYFRVSKNTKLTKSGSYNSNIVTIVFDYIPIEV